MYFPLLLSGVQAQYPVRRATWHHFPEASSPGGALWRGTADAPAVRRWFLRLEDLTDAEVESLVGLFDWCSGGWRTFAFADPTGNLLRWSEDLENAAWGKSSGITVQRSGAGEPAEFQVVNSGAATGQIWQELDLPPGALICLSCETAGEGVTLRVPGAHRTAPSSSQWLAGFAAGESTGGLQRVELEFPPGATILVRRVQAEMQIVPSEYQATFEWGGIFPKTRFAGNGLRIVAVAPDRNVVEATLESTMESAS